MRRGEIRTVAGPLVSGQCTSSENQASIIYVERGAEPARGSKRRLPSVSTPRECRHSASIPAGSHPWVMGAFHAPDKVLAPLES